MDIMNVLLEEIRVAAGLTEARKAKFEAGDQDEARQAFIHELLKLVSRYGQWRQKDEARNNIILLSSDLGDNIEKVVNVVGTWLRSNGYKVSDQRERGRPIDLGHEVSITYSKGYPNVTVKVKDVMVSQVIIWVSPGNKLEKLGKPADKPIFDFPERGQGSLFAK